MILTRAHLKRKLVLIGGILAITGGLTSSCTEWLDITPPSEIVLDDYWKTEGQAIAQLGSCYKAFTYDDAMYRLLFATELRSDNAEPNTIYKLDIDHDIRIEDILGMSEGDINSHNSITDWSSLYKVVNYCNIFLYYAKDVLNNDDNFTEAKLVSLEAEATALRALAYFNLVRLYNDVPYITEPSISDSQNYLVKKASGDSIIGVIVQDLESALVYAPSYHSTLSDSKGRITKDAIRAILADVCLWDEQYEKAVDYCNQIIDQEEYSLVDGEMMQYDIFYVGNSKESIFELQFGYGDDGYQFNNAVEHCYGSRNEDYPMMRAPTSIGIDIDGSPFKAKNGDEREKDLRYDGYMMNITKGVHGIFKYSGLISNETSTGGRSYTFRSNSANWILYRYADILLMKAEALVQLNRDENDLKTALELVNKTYLRSNPDVGSDSLQFSVYGDVSELESLVMRERRREFLFEGKRWFDLLRAAKRANNPKVLINKIALKYTGDAGNLLYLSAKNMNALYLPIFYSELNANPYLEQNSYYERLETEGE